MEPKSRALLEPVDFRKVVGHFASGVTVVTTEHAGTRFGATVSAVSSLCVEPPMVLACLNQRLGTHAAILASERFTINILGEHQGGLARLFATPGVDKFRDVDCTPTDHGPRLVEAIAHMSCTLVNSVAGGTHRIFVGRVVAAAANAQVGPLSYFRGEFGRFVAHQKAS